MNGRISSGPHRVGNGYNVNFSIDIRTDGSLSTLLCVWAPRPPADLGMIDLKRYRTARKKFMDKLALRLGYPVGCVEVAS